MSEALVLQEATDGAAEGGNYPGLHSNFKVRVPNPLQPSPPESMPIPAASVPKFIQILQSPEMISDDHEQMEDGDDMSELELDDYQDLMNDSEVIIGRPLPQTKSIPSTCNLTI